MRDAATQTPLGWAMAETGFQFANAASQAIENPRVAQAAHPAQPRPATASDAGPSGLSPRLESLRGNPFRANSTSTKRGRGSSSKKRLAGDILGHMVQVLDANAMCETQVKRRRMTTAADRELYTLNRRRGVCSTCKHRKQKCMHNLPQPEMHERSRSRTKALDDSEPGELPNQATVPSGSTPPMSSQILKPAVEDLSVTLNQLFEPYTSLIPAWVSQSALTSLGSDNATSCMGDQLARVASPEFDNLEDISWGYERVLLYGPALGYGQPMGGERWAQPSDSWLSRVGYGGRMVPVCPEILASCPHTPKERVNDHTFQRSLSEFSGWATPYPQMSLVHNVDSVHLANLDLDLSFPTYVGWAFNASQTDHSRNKHFSGFGRDAHLVESAQRVQLADSVMNVRRHPTKPTGMHRVMQPSRAVLGPRLESQHAPSQADEGLDGDASSDFRIDLEFAWSW
ncbi:hypothetical protein BDY21DRAFT_204706 [Lineolata rhizophorae]|uniref:Uncharacterized protein n=1 Tax=Lineolata rhizophorae TaxID=578093 RepID=A0A6A6P3W3_9PEZI|nr:hypothetical protein BDY21DRAFT_204706 [Lineolata rhizophorae]